MMVDYFAFGLFVTLTIVSWAGGFLACWDSIQYARIGFRRHAVEVISIGLLGCFAFTLGAFALLCTIELFKRTL